MTFEGQAEVSVSNVYASVNAGMNTFRDAFSGLGSFGGTLSPSWGFSAGYDFAPTISLRLNYLNSSSKGYTPHAEGYYGYGGMIEGADGTQYRKTKADWADLSGSVVINLTNLLGAHTVQPRDSWSLALGAGILHHLGFMPGEGSDNEVSGHAEVQYSRSLTRERDFTLDVKVRALACRNTYDPVFEKGGIKADLGLCVGLTYRFGHKAPASTLYAKSGDDNIENNETQYIKNPSNYLGNEPCVMHGSNPVFSFITKDRCLKTLTFYAFYQHNSSDILQAVNASFKNEAADFNLMRVQDLNAHDCLGQVSEMMGCDTAELLVSFADLYTAIETGGEMANKADLDYIGFIKSLLNDGAVTLIEIYGASSGEESGADLSSRRAQNISEWLKKAPAFSGAQVITYADRGVMLADTPGSRNLVSRYNRCAKVRIQVVY